MSSAVEQTIQRQTASYEKTMRSIAARQHVDLTELRRTTKYVGRNIARMDDRVDAGLRAITQLETEAATDRRHIALNLGNLVAITHVGFVLTLRQLQQISSQLDQIVQILSNWDDARAAAKREKGLYLASKDKLLLAVQHLKHAVALNPTDFVAWHALGFLYASNDQPDVAAAAFADSALFADANPALSAEAAILSARCYAQIGAEHTGWEVLRRAISRQCPDVALPLMKYANGSQQLRVAEQELAKAFLIDAELVIAAESMELDQIDEAAQEACRTLVTQARALNTSWDKLYDACHQAGVPMTREKPTPPRRALAPRTNLLNLAIYRRRMQMSLSNMRDEASACLENPIALPTPPPEPVFATMLGRRLQMAAFFLVVGLVSVLIQQYPFVVLMAIVIVAILIHDVPLVVEYFGERADYRRARDQVQQQSRAVHQQNAQFETYRDTVMEAVSDANETLAATIPPAVPRAFSSELVAYTSYRPHQF